MRLVFVGVALVVLLVPASASADRVDLHVKQLENGTGYKLRLSAALALGKTRDARATDALIYALENDSASTIRRVAALSLGKQIDGSTKKRLRLRALRALRTASRRDRDKRVRDTAKRALKELASVRSTRTPRVFIHIGEPSDVTKRAPRGTTRQMRTAVKSTVEDRTKYTVDWPSGRLPTKRELERAGTRAYFVGATVSRVKITKDGGRAEIVCSVSMRVNPWLGRDAKERWQASKAASATGNGKVIGSSTRSGIANAQRDCILAVARELTRSQVVPFIRRLAGR